MKSKKMVSCRTCGADIAKSAKVCPSCGAKNKKPIYKRWWAWALLVLVFLIATGGTDTDAEENTIPEAEFRSLCETFTYEEIARYPDNYDGKYAKFEGEAIQVMENGSRYTLRVNVTLGEYDMYTDTMYVTYTAPADTARILENDIITMYGILDGTTTYQSIFGESITIPKFDARYIDVK